MCFFFNGDFGFFTRRGGGVFNTKENSYSLQKHLYAHVRLDRQEYTEDDIARIKK